MLRHVFMFCGLAACLVSGGGASAKSDVVTGPNFVLIIADDCTYRDLELYGGQAKTPHLNKLAAEGMKFERCFQSSPMCSPTRHSLYTGLYPVKSGAYPNHTEAYDWVESIAHYLQRAGYRTFLSGKRHILPERVFPFEYSMRDNNPNPVAIEKGIRESVAAGQPFLLIAASNEPHSPWNQGDASVYPPEMLELPPIWVDTPQTRRAYSNYLAEVTYFDSQVGEVLSLLEKHDQVENTLVFVLSEQGNSFPFAKWTCYDAGLQSAAVVRWPGMVEAGSKSGALIEYVDVVPTMLDAAGLTLPDVLDGRSFLPVLKGDRSEHKTHVFGLQTSRGIFKGPDYYGIRSARNKRYLYIRNLTPEVNFRNTETNGAVFASWKKRAEGGDAHAQRLVHDYQHRPAEELYDCEADPWNRNNLIDDPGLEAVRDELRRELAAWMERQGDKGQTTELGARQRQPARQ